MDFEDICQIVETVVDLPVHSKRALLHDLAHRAALVLKVDDDTVFSALLKREELGSTGVGNGVALPHVRLEQVKKPFGILARLKHPIDFDAIDGQPVDLVCLLLLSKEKEQAQLNVNLDDLFHDTLKDIYFAEKITAYRRSHLDIVGLGTAVASNSRTVSYVLVRRF